MGKITAKRLEALTAADDGVTVREDGGLVGKVRAGKRGVTILFRYEFKLDGQKRDHRLGSWPKKTLAEIRAERDRVRVVATEGINPTAAKKAARIEAQAAVEATIAETKRKATHNLTVTDLFKEWIKDGVARQDGNEELERSFDKDVLPIIGNKPLSILAERDILAVLRGIRARGLNRSVVVRSNDIGQMLRWAEKRQPWRGLMVDGNPCDLVDVEALLDADYVEERDRILSPGELLELHNIFALLDSGYAALPPGQKYKGSKPIGRQIQLAMWICLSTLCRIGELMQAEWSQVDLDAATWLIPAHNTKGRRRQRQDHHVFLSQFALRQFKELHGLTGATRWLFPNRYKDGPISTKAYSKVIGDCQSMFKKGSKPLSGRRHDNSLVLANGKNGEWTLHDLRRTGATMMQGLGVTLEIIDRCQGHVLKGKVRRHYLHHAYAQEKREAWRLLAERIETILSAESGVRRIG